MVGLCDLRGVRVDGGRGLNYPLSMTDRPPRTVWQGAMTFCGVFMLCAATMFAVYREPIGGAGLAVIALVWLLAARLV